MSLKILIDLECSFTLVDEIYSYQVFFMIIIIIHTVWIQDKACSYSCFLLKPPAVQNLASASQRVIWRQPTHDLNIIHNSGKCRVDLEFTDPYFWGVFAVFVGLDLSFLFSFAVGLGTRSDRHPC